MSMKNSSDTKGNRTRDLPACSAAPQPTTSPSTPSSEEGTEIYIQFGLLAIFKMSNE